MNRTIAICIFASAVLSASELSAAGGALRLVSEEESDQSPAITRVQVWRERPGGKQVPIRKTVPAGVGVVLDRSVELLLPDGPYAFQMIRGPEYRVITGTFTLEPTSQDSHKVQLPRMIDMLEKGWTSGDCFVVASANSLPLRMASEDLHVATTAGDQEAKPIPYRKQDDPIGNDPIWIQTNAQHHDGLVIYGGPESQTSKRLPVARLVAAKNASIETKAAIENPFAWALPVWLASQKVDGIFLFGDWLRLDRKVTRIKQGRPPIGGGLGGGQAVGRWAEEIYRNVLDAGLKLPPLAGGGSDSANTPVGYNRLYVANQTASRYPDQPGDLTAVSSATDWWTGAWNGQSVATNGPMLRPRLGGKIPGHTFTARSGEALQLRPELSLSVRDPVEYLEVIHNNHVHYSARLDEFAKAGGVIPALTAKESGWVIIRVVTLHEEHYRAAVSAPWYIEFDGQPRVSQSSVDFFQRWLGDYEERLKQDSGTEISKHVPYIRAARQFWKEKAAVATP
jgi:hypothetical protein